MEVSNSGLSFTELKKEKEKNKKKREKNQKEYEHKTGDQHILSKIYLLLLNIEKHLFNKVIVLI